jgi:hypothetical protein
MPPRDPYLTRVNRALKELGCGVAIEVAPSGKRLRLRSTLPFPDDRHRGCGPCDRAGA